MTIDSEREPDHDRSVQDDLRRLNEDEARARHRDVTAILSIVQGMRVAEAPNPVVVPVSSGPPAEEILARYRAALPLDMRRLIEHELRGQMDWRKDAMKAPHRIWRWRTIRRYMRRNTQNG